MKKVSIVIPTYNEKENLSPLLSELFNYVDRDKFEAEIIIVDDNSPDGTGDVAEKLKSQYNIKVIHRAGKLGLGSAVREGFAAANGEIIGVMDADLSHDPAYLNKMLDAVSEGGADIVIGSRFQETSVVEGWKWWRRLISETGVFLTRVLTGVRDPLSGYFFFQKCVIDGVQLDTTGYKILLEILIKGKYKKAKEIPFRFRIRKFSTSKLDRKEYWLFLSQILRYSWYKLLNK